MKLHKSNKLNSKHSSKPKSLKVSGNVKQGTVTPRYTPVERHAWGVRQRTKFTAYLLKLGKAAFA